MNMFNQKSSPQSPAHEAGNPQSAVVIGLGRFGLSMATELEASGVEVLGIDCNAEVVQRASALIRHVVRADATDKEALAQLAVDEYACGVVTIGGDLAASILSASALLTLHCPQVWAKASSVEQGEILNQMGITRVFYPESDMGLRAAHQVAQSFEDYIDLGHGFALVITSLGPRYCGKTLGELDVRRRDGFSIVAIESPTGTWETAHAKTILSPEDRVMVVAPTRIISKITRQD